MVILTKEHICLDKCHDDYDSCAKTCAGNGFCLGLCGGKESRCSTECPCQPNCPFGCPCPVYKCEDSKTCEEKHKPEIAEVSLTCFGVGFIADLVQGALRA